MELSLKYGDFEVLETGWPRQDWIAEHRNDFNQEREQLLKQYGKQQIVLYAPTFSPKLTSLPLIKDNLVKLSKQKDVLLLMKFHPLTRQEWVDEYKALAAQYDNIVYVDDYSVTKYMLMADVMISDTSSTIYAFLLLDKPVVTLNAISKDVYWKNINNPDELCSAIDEVQENQKYIDLRKWVIANYDPYTDGQVARRMLEGVRDYIRRKGVPARRKLNLWRRYTSIKTFGFVRKQ